MTATRLTARQRAALRLVARATSPNRDEAITMTVAGPSYYGDGIAHINWRTADSLRRRGLVNVEYIGVDEGSEVWLTDPGWAVVGGDGKVTDDNG